MKLPITLGLVFSMSLTCAPAWASLSGVKVSPEEERQLDAGEVLIRNQSNGRILVIGQVSAPPEKVYQVYADFENYESSFGMAEARVLEKHGDSILGKFGIELPWPVGRRWARCAIKLDPDRFALDYHRLEGTFAEYDGELLVQPESGGKSRVLYAAHMDPGVPIPSWMVDWVKERQFRDIVIDVRKWLKRKG